MKLFDPCHVPIHRGVEHWNLIARAEWADLGLGADAVTVRRVAE